MTPARKSDSQWVISVTQELVDAKGANLGVLRLDISYETLEAYLNQLQLGQQGFAFIINENHEFVYHPKHTVYSSASAMEAMKLYIETGQGYTLDHQSYVSQEKIAGTDWTAWRVIIGKVRPGSESTNVDLAWSQFHVSSCLSLLGVA